MKKNISDILLRFIKKETFKDVSNFNEDTKLHEESILDSMGLVLLIDYIEEEFNIKLIDKDITEETFESVKSLVTLIKSKQNAT